MNLSFDLGLALWTIATFVALLLLLSRFAFGPLRRVLDERSRHIQSALDRAEHAKTEAERILGENEARLDGARDETRRIINEGHRIVDKMKKEVQSSAKRDADVIVEQARGEIDRELQKSLEELKGTVANLSIRISRQIIRGEIDETRHNELADEFIERLKKSHATRRN